MTLLLHRARSSAALALLTGAIEAELLPVEHRAVEHAGGGRTNL